MSSSQGYAQMTSVISQGSCQDWGFMGLGGGFSVEWIRKESLPFQCSQHILNPWNDNKKVQISRDGQVRERCYWMSIPSVTKTRSQITHTHARRIGLELPVAV